MFFLAKAKSIDRYLLALIIFAASSIYITFPLVLHIGDLATSTRDELLISWIQASVIKNLLQNPLGLFNGNIFFPYANTLAYSDLHFTSAIFSSLPVWLTGQPITAINFTLIFSLFALGFAAFLLTYHVTHDVFASIFAGLLIQFSPTTLDKNVHVQILAIEWVLLAVLFWLIFLKTKKMRYFVLALVFFILQTWNSFLPGYFILFSFTIVTLIFLRKNKKKLSFYFTKKHALLIFFSMLLIVPFVLPYYIVSKEFSYTRDIREAAHLSLQPEDLYYPNDLTRLHALLQSISRNPLHPKNAEYKVGYLGAVFSLLTIVTLLFSIKKRKTLSPVLLAFIAIALFGLILSFGPVLHFDRKTVHLPFVVPLPYSIFYYVVPGFQGIRGVYRWEMLFVLFMAISSSIVLSLLTKRFSVLKKRTLYSILFLLVILEYQPMRFTSVPQVSAFPPIYHYLKTLPKDTVIVEMPIYNWNVMPYSTKELDRVYYSTFHQKKTVNGASGFSPPPWQTMALRLLKDFPSMSTIQELRKIGVNYIVIHDEEYDLLKKEDFRMLDKKVDEGEDIVARVEKVKGIKMVKQFNKDYLFQIL